MSDDPRLPYAVQGTFRNNLRTFLCPSPQWALRKLEDFAKSGYANIAATGPDGPVTVADLRAAIASDGRPGNGAPVDIEAPCAPELVA